MTDSKPDAKPESKWGYKPQNDCIKPEHMKVNHQYAFTLNPKDQYFDASVTQIEDRLGKGISTIMKDISMTSSCIFILYPELSKMGRLHYHGTIETCDLYQFFLKDMPYLMEIGNVMIKEITPKDGDDKYWVNTYCQKQAHIMKKHVEALFVNRRGKQSYPICVKSSVYNLTKELNKEPVTEKKGRKPPV